MTAQKKEDLIYNAVTDRPHGTDTVQQLPQSAESRFSEIFTARPPVSKKMKIIMELALLSDESDSHIRDNIRNYLHYQPVKMTL